ncbi:MAG: Lrp/AsnC family transcriptional regulator [Gammaproteobacteria bacterium]|nr:Lrp/AsnC family transcriptional regulator [Gammaproteobacteria bacterium]
MQLDRTDIRILGCLRNNARITNKALAKLLDIAQSTCLGRVRRLVDIGAIHGFHADLNPKALGVGLQAMISIRLSRHSLDHVEAFRSHVMSLSEVVQIYHVAGHIDFLVHVWVKDTEHLRDLAMTSFTTREEVAHIETGLIFEHSIRGALPDFVGR